MALFFWGTGLMRPLCCAARLPGRTCTSSRQSPSLKQLQSVPVQAQVSTRVCVPACVLSVAVRAQSATGCVCCPALCRACKDVPCYQKRVLLHHCGAQQASDLGLNLHPMTHQFKPTHHRWLFWRARQWWRHVQWCTSLDVYPPLSSARSTPVYGRCV
jgi:hypothetical protein